jgi:hypothetical protein
MISISRARSIFIRKQLKPGPDLEFNATRSRPSTLSGLTGPLGALLDGAGAMEREGVDLAVGEEGVEHDDAALSGGHLHGALHQVAVALVGRVHPALVAREDRLAA